MGSRPDRRTSISLCLIALALIETLRDGDKSAVQSALKVRWTWRFLGAKLGFVGDADLRFVSTERRNYVGGGQAERRVRTRTLG